MLSKEIREDLEDRCKARIMFVAPYIAENSDGVPEQYYQVKMMDDTTTFYIIVDAFGATQKRRTEKCKKVRKGEQKNG